MFLVIFCFGEIHNLDIMSDNMVDNMGMAATSLATQDVHEALPMEPTHGKQQPELTHKKQHTCPSPVAICFQFFLFWRGASIMYYGR